ncbi:MULTISPECIES: beta-propeller fold lactonase family protein [unclassified Caballeronia]|uniref:lactonase family protein n=1 Tax=unclassified Caballeronia TaxID=2646786 RepID=UPI00025BC315|nr:MULTISPECIES: beta-propeller fold lactonase family protein [unclassified Caballeronia]EKS70230.1 3-carboxymuconate cyclase [Burkholderia sp. SJ98]MCE4546503.1 lactonase family protein [Caballeronia sp. PC1]MCE4573023.1 lactonase family protein [Caballeronia sp. CLC5]
MKQHILLAATMSAMLAACGGGSDDNPAPVHQLFAQTNDSSNTVVRFVRNADGTLTPKGTVATGGRGTNGVNYFMGNIVAPDALTSNNSLIVSPDGTRLFVANAGDNTVSTFSITSSGDLSLLAVSPTGGVRPTSLAFSNGVLYVTHQQGAQELGAYRVGSDGKLTSLAQYTVAVQDALPTQVAVSPDGKFVVVNGFLKTVTPVTPLNMLLAYPINNDGTLGQPVSSKSAGVGPFGGRFGSGALAAAYIVTEAAGGTASSYSLSSSGSFSTLSGPIAVTGQQAPCWIALTPDNKFAYVGNGSGAVSLFSLDTTGKLTLVNAAVATETAVAGQASAFANDSWISPDGKYLYQDYAGDDKIVSYAIGPNGTLTKLVEQPANTVSKISLQGLTGT